MRSQISTSLCLVALVIYAASLFLPAFTCAHTKSFPGYAVLAIGFMGVLGLDPRWFINLCFLLLLIASLRADSVRRPGIMLATAVLALASFVQAAGCEGGAGAPEVSTGLAMGGYLWVTSLLVACMANLSIRQTPDRPTEFSNTVPLQKERLGNNLMHQHQQSLNLPFQKARAGRPAQTNAG
jgi:hypothetical protein